MNTKYCKFKVGDEVITVHGVVGKISYICRCDKCMQRGFYEPAWLKLGNENDINYITIHDAESNFSDYYKIGEYRFNDFKKEEVVALKDSYEQIVQELEAQLRFIEDMED